MAYWMGLLDVDHKEIEDPGYERQLFAFGQPVDFGPAVHDWNPILYIALYDGKHDTFWREIIDVVPAEQVHVGDYAHINLQPNLNAGFNPWNWLKHLPSPAKPSGDTDDEASDDDDDDDEDDGWEDDWDDDDEDADEELHDAEEKDAEVDSDGFDWKLGRYRQ